MSPQERYTPASRAASGRGSSLRKVPGFTAAAVAFVLVVLLGVGGIAVAKWNQSANVTVGITAGAAPTTPSPSQGKIVVSPAIAQRPAVVEDVGCSSESSGDYTITWDKNAVSGVSYVVTLSGTLESKTVTSNKVNFKLANTAAAYGLYTVRIQPLKGTVAGDPVEITLQHQKNSKICYNPRPAAGTFAVRGVAAKNSKTVMNLSWDPAANATSYKISIKARNSSYGTEFTTDSLSATVTFPSWVSGWPDFYSHYDLRIQPMNGDQAGNPVYKVIQYYLWGLQMDN